MCEMIYWKNERVLTPFKVFFLKYENIESGFHAMKTFENPYPNSVGDEYSYLNLSQPNAWIRYLSNYLHRAWTMKTARCALLTTSTNQSEVVFVGMCQEWHIYGAGRADRKQILRNEFLINNSQYDFIENKNEVIYIYKEKFLPIIRKSVTKLKWQRFVHENSPLTTNNNMRPHCNTSLSAAHYSVLTATRFAFTLNLDAEKRQS